MERRDFLRALVLGGGLGFGPSGAVGAGATRPSSRQSGEPLSTLTWPHRGTSWQSEIAKLREIRPSSVRYRIALICDPHLAVRDKSLDFKALRYSSLIVEQHFLVLRHLKHLTGRGADAMLLAGDLTRDAEPWNHAAMRRLLRSLPCPSLVIPGNHDVFKRWMNPKIHWGLEKFVAAYQGRYGGYQGKTPYYANEILPGIVVIGLNSADTPDGALRDTWNGRIDDEQLRWFQSTVAKYAGKKQIIVMVHHNLLTHHPANREDSKSLWKNFHADNANRILAVMAKYDCRLVLTGHHHINRITKHSSGPITEICTAGACSYPSNIRLLDISADGKSCHVRTVGLPWLVLMDQIGLAASQDKFWKLPDQPHNPQAMLDYLWGRPQDREASILLTPTKG